MKFWKKWRLRSIEVEFWALFAKLRLVFGRRAGRRTARKPVPAEQRVQLNIFESTILDIAEKERKKAIREGRYVEAVVTSAFEQGVWNSVNQRQKKGRARPGGRT